jgi:hypothetical protein
MRSVVVVLPESMCALIPMLRMRPSFFCSSGVTGLRACKAAAEELNARSGKEARRTIWHSLPPDTLSGVERFKIAA